MPHTKFPKSLLKRTFIPFRKKVSYKQKSGIPLAERNELKLTLKNKPRSEIVNTLK